MTVRFFGPVPRLGYRKRQKVFERARENFFQKSFPAKKTNPTQPKSNKTKRDKK
jgi:hypothetical protein